MKRQCGRKIGIMGGSFDPIHFGHLVLAEQVRENFQLDEVIFIPVGGAPHKDEKGMTTKEARLEMTKLATRSNPHFSVSDIEIKKTGKTYTIDTIREIKASLEAGDELYFITGADAIMLLDSWKNYRELVQEVIFVAATRPGYEQSELSAKLDCFYQSFHADIRLTSVPALAISSTDIRKRIHQGMSARYLLPENVIEYINAKGLYQYVRE